MSKSISLNRKIIEFPKKENIIHQINEPHKKFINNHKFNKISSKEPSLPLYNNITNKLIERCFHTNYNNNIFNETENVKSNSNNYSNEPLNINSELSHLNNDKFLANTNINFNNNQEFITINDLIGEKCELNINILRLFFNNFDPSKTSKKGMGIVKSYGVNTYQGIVRNYNEDRVSIIINMNKPKDFTKSKWPKTSFFAIYDGHGGEGCSEYLRDNLHKLICNNEFFPQNIPEAIKLGISKAEQEFLNKYALSENKEEIIDKSGSCAIIILIVNTNLYIANVGDSRCLLSMNDGKKYIEVTKDHKPNSPSEIMRIKKNGGDIYQSQTVINNTENADLNGKILIGPYRVLPGRLSVCRTIGDAEAKIEKFGGNPNVIICEPEIYIYDLKKENIDFCILGCDGIYDQMSNDEILNCAWMILRENENELIKDCKNIHELSGLIVDFIIKSSLARKSFDNVTCLFLSLKDLGIKPKELEEYNDTKKTNKEFNNGITPQKIFPNSPIDPPNDMINMQNKKSNFEKIYTIKRKSNPLSQQSLNNFNNEEIKCKTNRNDNRFKLLSNNRFLNENKIFNSDYKLGSLNLNNELENKKNDSNNNNNQNLSVKDFVFEKNNNYHKIQAKQNINKDDNQNTVNNKYSHNKLQTSNLMAYSKKNQSFTKINKYLINLNNNNNYKQIKKNNNLNNYNTYTTKKISEGNIINKRNENTIGNNSQISKPIRKFDLSQPPLKVIESKNSFTNSTKNLSLTNKNSLILNKLNTLNKNPTQLSNDSTKNHRLLITNKENRNSAYLSFNNSNYNFNNNKMNLTQNQNPLNKNFVNINEQYKYQSHLINNSNNNFSSFSNQNINVNQRKSKKHLSLNNPTNSSSNLSNNFIINKNTNNVFTSRIKRDITSKIRKISMQKSLPNTNFRLNHQINGGNSSHNLSMQSIQLNNNMHNFNYGDKIQKVKTYKLGNKNYQNTTFNKNNNYNSRKYNHNGDNYLMTDLGRTKKDFLFEDIKKNIF